MTKIGFIYYNSVDFDFGGGKKWRELINQIIEEELKNMDSLHVLKVLLWIKEEEKVVKN